MLHPTAPRLTGADMWPGWGTKAFRRPVRPVIKKARACWAAAGGPFAGLGFRLPSFLQRPDPEQAQLQEDRDSLLRMLLGGRQAAGSSVSELVEKLAGSRLPFQEKRLGGGPWVVLHTQGSLQLWKATYNAAKVANSSNIASQDFDPSTRTAVNRAEYYGGSIWVSASGSYEPVDASSSCPKQVAVTISSGKLHLWGWELALPIQGVGYFEVMYCDDDLRVFRSGASYAVQVRAAALPELKANLLSAA